MNETLRKRIERKLESLPDQRAYQILDYIDFLEARYGEAEIEPSPLQKFAETVEDTLRASRIPVNAIRGTMGVVEAAGRVVDGIVDAGKAAMREVSPETSAPKADEKSDQAEEVTSPPSDDNLRHEKGT